DRFRRATSPRLGPCVAGAVAAGHASKRFDLKFPDLKILPDLVVVFLVWLYLFAYHRHSRGIADDHKERIAKSPVMLILFYFIKVIFIMGVRRFAEAGIGWLFFKYSPHDILFL